MTGGAGRASGLGLGVALLAGLLLGPTAGAQDGSRGLGETRVDGRSETLDAADAAALSAKKVAPGAAQADEAKGPTEAQRRSRSYWLFEAPVPSPEELAADPDAHLELLDQNGLVLDLDARTVSVRGGVVHDRFSLEYPIEYLITTERGKTYEAVFLVKARPKVLDACLQAVGLRPGTGMSYAFLDPPPENPDEPDYWTTPASGPLAAIDVVWIDDGGAAHRASLESMLVDLRTGEELDGQGWIYVGSRTAQIRQGRTGVVERFLADVEGNLVAIYLDGRGTCLFERNSLAGIDTPYTIHPDRVPPRGSSVTLQFRPTDEVVAPRDPFPGHLPEPDPPPAGTGTPATTSPQDGSADADADTADADRDG